MIILAVLAIQLGLSIAFFLTVRVIKKDPSGSIRTQKMEHILLTQNAPLTTPLLVFSYTHRIR